MSEQSSQEIRVPVKVKWKGALVTDAEIGDFNICMDTPSHEKQKGKSVGPSATELFMVALGRCTLVSILKAAENKGITIKDLSLELIGKLKKRDYGEQKIHDSVWVYFDIEKNLDIVAETDKRKVAEIIRDSHKYCTVGIAIENSILGDFTKINLKNGKDH